MAELLLKSIRKAYGAVEVIKSIDLEIEHGEFCVFVGPSGCGKSTLLRMISGLDDVTSGDIEIEGEVVNNVTAADRGLAMVFQSYALYPHMTVRQNLSFGLENLRTPKSEIETKISEAATMLQIDHLLERRPKDLSGGQRQRVAIGRAVVREPRIFLFDEPLSNLDAELRVEMRGEISSLHRRLGNTMIYVTHDQVEAMTMADKIVVLRGGIIEQVGRPLDLYNNPANQFVAGFLGTPRMNFFDATLDPSSTPMAKLPNGEGMGFDPSAFKPPSNSSVVAGIRPKDVRVVEKTTGSISAKVVSVEQLGGESYIFAKTMDGSDLTVLQDGQTRSQPDEVIHVLPAENALHLFDKSSGLSLRAPA